MFDTYTDNVEPISLAGATCLDCCNFTEDETEGCCKLANHPAVQQFCADPEAWDDGDMRACPGFVEDN